MFSPLHTDKEKGGGGERVRRRVRMGEKKCESAGQKEGSIEIWMQAGKETGSDGERLEGKLWMSWCVCISVCLTA